ncbi:hypothetical protein [Mesorhizobium sp. B2-1-2]|uniref:hypothetical protein n=1 Tax=Mesorhizobium sp. B2-1-2 TaxID=2589973 RepID=UPI00112B23F0|nr:hypothetical protein [Mesorhizobium sp. B2-1-2]TPN11704.1 hypothetical protein FJ971_09865 [Mesorhizobium sp. B2-1-2]
MGYRDWYAGMKVVYIGGSSILRHRRGIRRLFRKWDRRDGSLKEGDVYELLEISVGKNLLTGEEEIGVSLKDDPDGDAEGMYPARCFRPAQPRATDISTFTAMLTKPKVPA